MDNSKLYKNLCDFREKTYTVFLNEKHKNNSKLYNVSAYDEHYLEIISTLEKSKLSVFSAMAKISRPAGTKVVKKFIEKGYLVKTLNKNDNREYLIELSDCAKAYMEENRKLFAEILDRKISVLTEKEVKELNRIIQKLLDKNEWGNDV